MVTVFIIGISFSLRFVNVRNILNPTSFLQVIIMINEVNCVEKCSHICNTTYFLLAVRKLDTTLTILEAEGVDMRCSENLFGNLFHGRKCVYLFFWLMISWNTTLLWAKKESNFVFSTFMGQQRKVYYFFCRKHSSGFASGLEWPHF